MHDASVSAAVMQYQVLLALVLLVARLLQRSDV
jgi:hypothetical protein